MEKKTNETDKSKSGSRINSVSDTNVSEKMIMKYLDRDLHLPKKQDPVSKQKCIPNCNINFIMSFKALYIDM